VALVVIREMWLAGEARGFMWLWLEHVPRLPFSLLVAPEGHPVIQPL